MSNILTLVSTLEAALISIDQGEIELRQLNEIILQNKARQDAITTVIDKARESYNEIAQQAAVAGLPMESLEKAARQRIKALAAIAGGNVEMPIYGGVSGASIPAGTDGRRQKWSPERRAAMQARIAERAKMKITGEGEPQELAPVPVPAAAIPAFETMAPVETNLPARTVAVVRNQPNKTVVGEFKPGAEILEEAKAETAAVEPEQDQPQIIISDEELADIMAEPTVELEAHPGQPAPALEVVHAEPASPAPAPGAEEVLPAVVEAPGSTASDNLFAGALDASDDDDIFSQVISTKSAIPGMSM